MTKKSNQEAHKKLQVELLTLREELERVRREKEDLELLVEMTAEHSDEVADEMEDRLNAMELLQQAQGREGWAALKSRQRARLGYHFASGNVGLLRTVPSGAGLYMVPMRAQQEQIVGVLGVADTAENPLPEDDRLLLDALAQQVAAALERARLFEDTRRNAAREQIVSELSARMRASLDIDTVLQTTVRDIGDTLKFAHVEVRLDSATAPATGVTKIKDEQI